MNDNKKVIVLEFNELCPELLERFMKAGELPSFSKLYKCAEIFTTDAQCDVEYLEPWTQWVTLHTGLPFEKHKVFRLGQAQNLKYASIWDVLAKQNKTSWLCGSMNIKWDSKDTKITALPDPWSIDVMASPNSLQPFYDFVRANVQEHSNTNFTLSIADYGRFFWFMLRHGLSFTTSKKLATSVWKQLTKADDRWKKAMLLDWLQFDVFKHVYQQQQPHFATFFSNSTAHFQHKFWRYMEPEKFPLKPSDAEIARYGNAVLYAYKNHDALIAEVLQMVDKDTVVILASALSQQPYTKKDDEGGKRFYRPHNIQNLPNIFGLTGVEKVGPVMSHQFHLICENDKSAKQNFELLQAMLFNGEPLFSLRLEGSDVFGGCQIYRQIAEDTMLQLNGHQVPFSEIFYLADSLKSGMHHPHGVFWVSQQGRKQLVHNDPIPLSQTMPKILQEFGL
ncbi:MAG: alkaline phosphatase family protein [Paraglaciecola sp.]|nr:alkaline phosphatase family protein [Paraglaciecola sp.]